MKKTNIQLKTTFSSDERILRPDGIRPIFGKKDIELMEPTGKIISSSGFDIKKPDMELLTQMCRPNIFCTVNTSLKEVDQQFIIPVYERRFAPMMVKFEKSNERVINVGKVSASYVSTLDKLSYIHLLQFYSRAFCIRNIEHATRLTSYFFKGMFEVCSSLMKLNDIGKIVLNKYTKVYRIFVPDTRSKALYLINMFLDYGVVKGGKELPRVRRSLLIEELCCNLYEDKTWGLNHIIIRDDSRFKWGTHGRI